MRPRDGASQMTSQFYIWGMHFGLQRVTSNYRGVTHRLQKMRTSSGVAPICRLSCLSAVYDAASSQSCEKVGMCRSWLGSPDINVRFSRFVLWPDKGSPRFTCKCLCLQGTVVWRARLATADMGGLLDDGVIERTWFGASLVLRHMLHPPASAQRHLRGMHTTFYDFPAFTENAIVHEGMCPNAFSITVCHLVAASDARGCSRKPQK